MGVAIRRNCDLCGTPYVAKSSLSKFCTPKCRLRNHEGKPPVAKPRAVVIDTATGVTNETIRTLTALGKLDTPEGQAALVLAAKIDAGLDPLSAINGAVKQLGDTLAELRRVSPVAVSPQDELRRRREERLAKARAGA